MEISKNAIVCAARHFVAAHESACTGRPVAFGAVCVGCSVYEQCRADWLETAAPLFDAAGIYPQIIRPFRREVREMQENSLWTEFWALYPRHERQAAAQKVWDDLQLSDAQAREIILALRRQLNTETWQKGIGIPYAAVWLRRRAWED